MTPDDMVTHIASLLGNVGTTINSQILQDLKNAQVELEGRGTLPYQLLKEASATTTSGEPRVAVPDDFLKEYEESALYFVDSDGYFNALCKGFQDDNRTYWNRDYSGDDDTEGPKAYSLVAGYFFLYPTPSAAYTIRMYYYAKDSVLDSGGAANLWSTHYPELLMGMAGRNALMHSGVLLEEKQVALARFEQMAQEGMRRLIASNTAREVANMELSYGGG